jgi:transcriptional antiterminator RfaH
MERWYTLYSKPNAEYQVARVLQERGILVYLPETESSTARNGHIQRPFFPCYLFMKVDLAVVGLSQVEWTPGLRRVVAFDDRPVPLPDHVIELIRSKLEEMNTAGGWPACPFQPGDTVCINNGPLQGMLAIFDRPTTPSERVQVLLTFLGHVSRVWVPAVDLERAPPGAEMTQPKRPRRTRGQGRRIRQRDLREITAKAQDAEGAAA